MRSNQQKSRSRGRNNNNNNNRRNSNPLSRSYESNGPDVRVRGNAAHVAEKYVQLAQDANQTGDSVAAENYLQHAEHYFRIVSAAQAQVATQQQAQQAAHQAQQAANQARQVEHKPNDNNGAGPAPGNETKTETAQGGEGASSTDQAASDEALPLVPKSGDAPARPRRPRRRPRTQDTPAPAASAADAGTQDSATQDSAAQGSIAQGTPPVSPAPVKSKSSSDSASGSTSDPASAPQPDAGDLPAFVTNANESNAAE